MREYIMIHYTFVCSTASFVTAIGGLIMLIVESKIRSTTEIDTITSFRAIMGKLMLLLIFLAIITYVLWFYICPDNRLIGKIEKRMIYTLSDGTSIIEDEINFNSYNEYPRIFKAAFDKEPAISFEPYDGQAQREPKVVKKTKDMFVAKIENGAPFGKWKYRARGKLQKIDKQ